VSFSPLFSRCAVIIQYVFNEVRIDGYKDYPHNIRFAVVRGCSSFYKGKTHSTSSQKFPIFLLWTSERVMLLERYEI